MTAPVWLPKGFEFLAGYPTPIRKRKLLLPLHAIVDDSGGPNQTFQVMAGLIGQAEDWARFADAWQDCLDTSPKVRAFHMAKIRDGDWHGLSQKQRNDKLRSLARVIADKRFGLKVLVAGVHMEGWESFREVIEASTGQPFVSSYFYVYQLMLMVATAEAMQRGIKDGTRERFSIFFDEQSLHGSRAKAYYPTMRNVMADASDFLPIEPQFENDERFLPLQAADMVAWFCRKDFALENHPYGWLASEVKAVPVSGHSHIEYAQDY